METDRAHKLFEKGTTKARKCQRAYTTVNLAGIEKKWGSYRRRKNRRIRANAWGSKQRWYSKVAGDEEGVIRTQHNFLWARRWTHESGKKNGGGMR